MRQNMIRSQEWDFVKAILIIFVVWGHVCSYISDSSYERNVLTSVIRLYQMPMFIMISGYFQKKCLSYSDVIKKWKKILFQLCIPYLVWCIIGAFTVVFVDSFFDHSEIEYTLFDFLILVARESNILWYLGCLIICEFIYALLSCLSMKNQLPIIIFTILVSFISPFDIWHFAFLWIFFLFGTNLSKYKQIINNREYKRKELIASLTICGVLLLLSFLYRTEYTFYNYKNFIFAQGFQGMVPRCLIVVFRYIVYGFTTVSYLFFFHCLYKFICKYNFVKIICAVGRNTLGIFLIHILFLYHVFLPAVRYITHNHGLLPSHEFIRYYIVGTLITVIVVACSNYFTRCILRNNMLSKMLLGK